jgi:hypothetical protein
MKQLPTKLILKPRQTEILTLLYRFRFLNRLQIQTLLNHKSKSRILTWLNELITEQYIKQYFDKQIAASISVYSLGPMGRKYLKQNADTLKINLALLDRIRREKSLSLTFRNHCLFLADIYLSLIQLTVKTKAKLHLYTATDLSVIEDFIKPSPDLYFAIVEANGSTKRFFLDVLNDGAPKVMRSRVRRYVNYFKSDEWQSNTDKPFPEIILVCPNDRLKHHLFFYIQKQLIDEPDMNFYLSTRDQIKFKGVCIDVLQKVTEEE